LVQLPTADLAERLRGGDYVAAVVDISMGLEPDLYPLLASSQVRASGSNLSGYQDTELDPLLEAARAVGTPEQRAAAWKALLAGLAERRPILPVVWSDEVVFARGLENVTPRLITAPGDRFWDVLAWRLAADR
jgi:ABC-type transport system substrate-binding protein